MFSRIEQNLLDRGHVRTAVTVQNAAKVMAALCPLYWHRISPQKTWVEEILKADFEIMDRIQAEAADIQNADRIEKLQKLNGKLTQEEKQRLEEIQHQISDHEHQWWYRIFNYYNVLYDKPKGCYTRKWDLARNGYFHFTQEEVQSACKSIGGCCAYSCGCCYRDRGSSRMPGAVMHCGRNCVCCLQRRAPRCLRRIGPCIVRVLVIDYYFRNRIKP